MNPQTWHQMHEKETEHSQSSHDVSELADIMASQLEMYREILETLKAITVLLETHVEINETNNTIVGAIS